MNKKIFLTVLLIPAIIVACGKAEEAKKVTSSTQAISTSMVGSWSQLDNWTQGTNKDGKITIDIALSQTTFKISCATVGTNRITSDPQIYPSKQTGQTLFVDSDEIDAFMVKIEEQASYNCVFTIYPSEYAFTLAFENISSGVAKVTYNNGKLLGIFQKTK